MNALSKVWAKIREIAQEDEGEPNVVAVIIFAIILILCGGMTVAILSLLN